MTTDDLPRGVPPGTTWDELAHLVEKLRRIPDRVRILDRTPHWAWTRLRLRPELLSCLTELGLPRRTAEDGLLYDRYDLANSAMQLGQGPLARSARRFWPIAMDRVDAGTSTRYEMKYQMRCPDPGHGPVCHYLLTLPGGEVVARDVPAGETMPDVTVEIVPEIDWPELPDRMRAPLAAVGELDFMLLREEIRRDLSFVRDSGLADCAGTAILVVEEARKLGLRARASFGCVVAPPFGVEHYWAELLVGDRWLPVDPVLIRQMVVWGVLDGDRWPPHRSIGPLVARIGDLGVPLVRHEGEEIPSTLPVRLLTEPVGAA
ncbi:hypothetical protein GCM10010172_65840 [Paractinoplanes ferrugineus]|uniref:Transglutaminase-like domain-containing protein n=1 Tax=Paractinoplanes ferrugineus TaxID=113564 RepID=A0A919J2D2_9ACTN|nr:transglutaminase domain-containing protein [Actinoplanes ferrugineus]GIE13255.1 hypothetical protein Afe05nite_50950 [Actinoplanes ferrugineus]